jgi:Outer membrane protein beta-barrel domain
MQDIDQNMDDLFRKAAADYPLNLSEGQWDDIAPLLQASQVKEAVPKKNSSKKYTALVIIFLSLLLATGLITNIFNPARQNSQWISSSTKTKETWTGISDEKSGYTKDKITGKRIWQQDDNADRSSLQPLNAKFPPGIKKENIQKQKPGNESLKNKNGRSSTDNSIDTNSLATTLIGTTNDVVMGIEQEAIITGNKNKPGIDGTHQIEDQIATETSHMKKRPVRRTAMYWGIVAGPLFDEVKNQGLKKTGFSAGIIAGFQFKNNLSLETGLLYAKKPYFSTGKYFRMDKISSNMPPGMEMLSLEGKNSILEIPLKMKYDLLNRNKNNFFLSAGITSYINTHEKNNYLVLINGTQQTMVSSYKNKSRSLAATVDISAGYEHKIGKLNRIRIEPYLQIPLRGMGVGSMPMMSSGLRIGITQFTR